MPYLYLYSPDDFVQGLPDESGAMAAGSPGFTLTLKADAAPTLVEVTDDDLVFDEVDGSKTLARTVNLDGDTIAAGTSINSAYDLIDTGSGHKVTSFHFGGDGYQQGPVDGIASTVELTPGASYSFNTERTSHQQNNQYTDFAACFSMGTLIATPDGPRTVETIGPGTLIDTADHGPRPVLTVLQRRIGVSDLRDTPRLRPIVICAGALGQGLPGRDLRVSPQHRLLVASPIVARMFGAGEALIAAHRLTGLPGIFPAPGLAPVTYLHVVMDRHEVIFANGAPTESLYLGPGARASLTEVARIELATLFPDLFTASAWPAAARPIPCGRQQKRCIARHGKNAKPLLQGDWPRSAGSRQGEAPAMA